MRDAADFFSNDAVRDDLKGKTVRGGLVTGIAQAIQIGTQLLAVPILGRLLQPEDFGLVAMVAVFTAFAGMFVDVGLSTATVQWRKIDHFQVTNLFWIATGAGVLVAATVAAFSPAIAWIYHEPRLTAITLVLCPTFVFAGLTMQHQALLRRAMYFRALAIVQVISVVTSYAVAIGWAWWTRSYWAMAALPFTAAFVKMAGTWIICGWIPGLPRRGTGLRALISFGGFFTGCNLMSYFSRNVDNLLIGWYWGATPLGFYERAYKLMLFPMQQINGPLTGVVLPALSRVLDEPIRYRRIYLSMLETVLLVSTPLMAFAVVHRDLCVNVLLGPEWGAAIPIFAWLGIVACLQPFSSTLTWGLVSQGRTRELFQWTVVATTVYVIAFAIGLAWGPTYVAAAYLFAYAFVNMPLLVRVATRSGPIRARDLPSSMRLPAILTLIVVLGSLITRWMFSTGNDFVDLTVNLAVAAAIWVAVMFATSHGQRWLNLFATSIIVKNRD